ncbi:hypothetical protein DFH06DRAFT_1475115 [Mycena polygramma]|nr:hypothetical protein DFH06DRAFT_1475115 [Mycena polygramma]
MLLITQVARPATAVPARRASADRFPAGRLLLGVAGVGYPLLPTVSQPHLLSMRMKHDTLRTAPRESCLIPWTCVKSCGTRTGTALLDDVSVSPSPGARTRCTCPDRSSPHLRPSSRWDTSIDSLPPHSHPAHAPSCAISRGIAPQLVDHPPHPIRHVLLFPAADEAAAMCFSTPTPHLTVKGCFTSPRAILERAAHSSLAHPLPLLCRRIDPNRQSSLPLTAAAHSTALATKPVRTASMVRALRGSRCTYVPPRRTTAADDVLRGHEDGMGVRTDECGICSFSDAPALRRVSSHLTAVLFCCTGTRDAITHSLGVFRSRADGRDVKEHRYPQRAHLVRFLLMFRSLFLLRLLPAAVKEGVRRRLFLRTSVIRVYARPLILSTSSFTEIAQVGQTPPTPMRSLPLLGDLIAQIGKRKLSYR